MDQESIGKFIAECRKKKGLTQAVLGEQLGITDRAVSKWETGKSMPDVSIMLQLCDLLGITVNELLSGEQIAVEDYKEQAEKNLLEMRHKEAGANRRLLNVEIVLVILSIAACVTLIVSATYLTQPGAVHIVLTVIGLAIGAVGLGTAMVMEFRTGYYECPYCHERYVPDSRKALIACHVGWRRRLRCPYCGQIGYHKKVLSRD